MQIFGAALSHIFSCGFSYMWSQAPSLFLAAKRKGVCRKGNTDCCYLISCSSWMCLKCSQEKEVGLKGKKTRTRSNSHYMRQICRISGSEWVQHPSAELSSLWDKQLHSVWPSRRKYNSFGSRHALPDLNKAVRIVFSSISQWVLLRSLLGES